MSDRQPLTSELRHGSSFRLKVAVVLGILLSIPITALVVWHQSHHYHLDTVQEGILYRDGFKSIAQFSATLDSVHPRTVISLLDSQELADPKKPQFASEEKLCADRGIKLQRIPVALGGWPTSQDIQTFLKIVGQKENQPVLVHCAQGVRRTGFFVGAFEASVLGYNKGHVENDILSFGHGSSTIDQIKKFIEAYDPKTQTIPADLGHGAE
jgi:protein tyrosine/serine phosphatase